MSAKIMLTALRSAMKAEHLVFVFAEGKAIEICQQHDISCVVASDDKHYTADYATGAIRTIKPHAVLIGCSSPIKGELVFAKEARKAGVPIVAFADIWGALCRLDGFVPDLGIVIDQVAIDIEKDRAKKFAIIGDPAEETARALGFADMTMWRQKIATLEQEGCQTVLVVGDNNDVVEDICRVAANSMCQSKDPRKIRVVPRLVHPKFAQVPEVQEIVKRCLRYFDGLKVDLFETPKERASTDWLATVCDYTFTSYSTPGRIALHSGKRFVSVATPMCQQWMEKELALNVYPLYDACVVPAIDQGVNLENLDWDEYDATAKSWSKKAKFRPEAALNAILELAGN